MKLKRIIAFLIDIYIAIIISYVPLGILTQGSYKITRLFDYLIYLTFYFTLIIFKDTIFRNQSIGKKIFKLKIVKNDGSLPTCKEIILRNILFLFTSPVSIPIFVITNMTISDYILKTRIKKVN